METAQDPLEEVRKLQELVRKLELQNQQLRKNQSEKEDSNSENNADTAVEVEGTEKPLRRSLLLEDVGLINIEDIDVADEDSWLYASPKGMSAEDEAISLHKWLRKDVEDPQNRELQLARRALAYKLDELAILNPSNRPEPKLFGLPDHKPPIGRIIDSRTFTRGKKKRHPYDDSRSVAILESIGGEYEEDAPPSPTPRVSAPTDVIDVQEIARMQEESLRQSSPSSTPKRIAMGGFGVIHRPNTLSNSNGKELGVALTSETRTMPRPGIPNNHYQNSCNTSTHSSPSESLNGSNNSLDKPNDSFHNSLPNISKGCNGIPRGRAYLGGGGTNGGNLPPRSLPLGSRVMSPSRIDRRLGVPSRSVTNLRSASPSRRLPNGTTSSPPVVPVAPTRVVSPGRSRLTPPSAGSSPVRSGLPLPKSSKIPPPKPRSAIPVPSSSRSHYSDAVQSSDNDMWSDGCY